MSDELELGVLERSECPQRLLWELAMARIASGGGETIHLADALRWATFQILNLPEGPLEIHAIDEGVEVGDQQRLVKAQRVWVVDAPLEEGTVQIRVERRLTEEGTRRSDGR